MVDGPRDSSWTAFWRTVSKFEQEKITPGLALRNCVGVLIPIGIGVATGQAAAGLVVGTGALNVCFTDGPEPYRARGRRMLTASALVGFAVFAGGLSGRNDTIAVLLAGAWAFAAGMLVAIGTEAADLGTISLVTLVVFAAQSMDPQTASLSGLLAFGGGLLQTALSLSLWPVRRYAPERRTLGALYLELARAAASPIEATAAPPATPQILQAQKALATLALDHSIESERYRSLLNQAERIRLALMVLARLRTRIQCESTGQAYSDTLDDFFRHVSRLLLSIGNSLLSPGAAEPDARQEVPTLTAENDAAIPAALIQDAAWQVEAIAGQLRAALDLASHATPAGLEAFEERESRRQWRLRLDSRIAILRANLSLDSAACRHAIRLALAVALGDALGRLVSFRRPYWIPMTIAIVLKPDFTSTFSRGVLRLAGTFAGLALATALFHFMAPPLALQVALIGLFVFLLRCFGGANYGIFVTAVSALVVVLIAITGIAPSQVILARGLNSAAGGTLALLSYIVWPTWEKTQVADAFARMLDAYRDYFRVVVLAYVGQGSAWTADLSRARHAARLARSNAEASVDRLSAEPGVDLPSISALNAMLASSHRLVHAVMALEAGAPASRTVTPREAFRALANHVELTLYLLAANLRGAPLESQELPDLRQAHKLLISAGDAANQRYALSNVEMDRVVNSLNTLSGQVLSWRKRPSAGVS